MIVWDFIYAREGGLSLQGYVPQKSDASGVTIGAGFDLGQQGERELTILPIPLRDRLRPYFGRKGDHARAYLRAHPLAVSESEARTIMAPARRRYADLAQTHFDRSAPIIPFDRLPDGASTVILSVTWQYGDPWTDKKCGDFWKIATRCDWPALAAYLRAFPDRRFITRRRLEADFLLAHSGEFDGKNWMLKHE